MKHTHKANRREDLRLITGRGRYASDWNLPGQLHCAFLRSPHAHAEIVSVDCARALEHPGVVAVYTGKDAVAAGYTEFPLLGKFKNRSGVELLKPARSVLAHDKVRFVGDAVAMVVAESAAAAHDALDAIEVEYRELPPAVTVEDALAPGAPQLHSNIPGNLCFETDIGDAATTERAFAQAAHVTRIEVVSTRVIPSPMEPRAYLVSFDAATESYDIYTPAQGVNMLASQIAMLAHVPEDKLRLHLHDVGGSFGQRSSAYPEHGAMMMASKKLGRPLKWISSRSESFLTDTHGRGIHWKGELALGRDGKFLAARYAAMLEVGAYLAPTSPGGHLRNPSTCMTGVYHIPAIHGSFKVVLTSATPLAAYRGAGRPDIAYVVERLVDKAAHELKLDRAELRRRNFIPPAAFPYKTATESVYEKSDFAGCLDKALAAADWGGFETRRTAAAKRGRLRGIGMSTVIEGTGPGNAPVDQIAIEFDTHGAINVYAASLAGGQGHLTAYASIVAETLGVSSDAVTVHESVIGKDLIGNGAGGSRSIVGAGSVCHLAAEKLIKQALPLAAEDLGLEPSQVDYRDGTFHARLGDQAVSLEALARKLAGSGEHPLNVVAEAKFGATFPNGCHITEVEIDPETGLTEVVSYVAVDDCGRAINHHHVEGQVQGGVVQGAGQVYGEQIVYDRESGQLLTGSFSDYYMPHAGLVKNIRLYEHLTPSASNPLGVKGVGESGCTASLPALTNATMDALRPLGIGELEMPFTPSKVWHAIAAAKR